MVIALIVVAWVACGIGAAGLDFAYFQSRYPGLAERNRREDLGQALLTGLLFGPLGLLVWVFESGFAEHGWRLR